MNKEQIKWLQNIFPQYRDRVMRADTLQAYYEAERILLGLEQINKRGCSCNYKRMQAEINKLYDTWQMQINT